MPETADPTESIFVAAVALPAEERAAYLDHACADDPALRARLEALLRAHDQAGHLLDRPAANGSDRTGAYAPALPVGAVVAGRYKLLEEIGEGGMGTVFVAEQTEPVRRKVALKLIKPGMDSRSVLARFEAERQALALMDHPNIAKVLDGGLTETGRPFFVMDYVKGAPITEYCDATRLSIPERLALFGQVCQAVQHAHQKGIIHRDLKPSNILVAPYDDKPVPKVIDFGLAKAMHQSLTERTLHTAHDTVLGTPLYMSPEQAQLNNLDIDTRSDIYSLGVLLYELLTGTTPLEKRRFKEAAWDEIRRVIREEEPSRPSTRLSTTQELPSIAASRGLEPKRLSGAIRGELDWIVMKALEKDRNRRYETANGFAADVQRYLADEPVQACPPSAWYRFRKFARRNRTALAVAGMILFFILILGGGGGWVVRDREARQREAEGRVLDALSAVEPRLRDGRPWDLDLASAAQRVEAELEGGALGPEVRRRADQLRQDMRMLVELDGIRLRQAESKDGQMFDSAGSEARYAAAFSRYGIDVAALEPSEVAARVRASAIREALVAGLDGWMQVKPASDGDRARLRAAADGADDSAWRRAFREAALAGDAPELKALAGQAEALAQPPSVLAWLGSVLDAAGLLNEAEPVLRQAQQRYPEDFWINYNLGHFLIFSRRPRVLPADAQEAVGYFRAAVAIRPASAEARSILGVALMCKNDTDGAIAAYQQAIALDARFYIPHVLLGDALLPRRDLEGAVAEYGKAIALQPDQWDAHYGLAGVLAERGKLAEAEAEYRRAFALKPDQWYIHSRLARVLERQGKLAEAEAEYRTALAVGPDNVFAHGNLARVLERRGKPQEAAAEYGKADALRSVDPNNTEALYRKAVNACAVSHVNLANLLAELEKPEEAAVECRTAIALQPDFMQAQINLAFLLGDLGRFADAVAVSKRVCELGARDPRWIEANNWQNRIQQYQRRAMLEALAPVFLRGEAQPADPRVGLALADICQFNKHRYAAAAHFYEEAFAAEPWLEENMRFMTHNQSRYRAACAAALAGCGGGEDAPAAEVDRARLRRRALEWLQAELAAQQLLLEQKVSPPLIEREVDVWTWNRDFAGVRDQEALAKLPEAERHDWERLWRSVRALAVKAGVAPVRAAPAPR